MLAPTAQGHAERAELEAILNSGIFSRAPNLAKFLQYVCERHLSGEADSLKEYSIAVEALGRSADFDQKKDSIVRVEAHRLRKRLAEYYAGVGAAHALQIEIPNGQYAPLFVAKPGTTPEEVEVVPNLAPKPTPKLVWAVAGVSGVVLLAALLGWGRGSTKQQRKTTSNLATKAAREVWRGSYAEPVDGEYRFLAGYQGPPITDRQGRVWRPDAYFDGGESIARRSNSTVDGAPDDSFIVGQREGDFSYKIPARQGTYEMHLYFLETHPPIDSSDPAGLVTFGVRLNEKAVLGSFDPMTEAGASNRLHSRVLRDVMPAKDGAIHLSFESQSNKAFLNAAEILPSEPGKVRPIRLVAGRSSVTDSNGAVWAADQYVSGGVLVTRKVSVKDSPYKFLFVCERYGHFTYRLPAPPGKYRLKLFFAETFFGSQLPWAPRESVGMRLFNVFADGRELLRGFDVSREAGGSNKALVKTFSNLEPNAQGLIVLEFQPIRNYAEINAIELTQMN